MQDPGSLISFVEQLSQRIAPRRPFARAVEAMLLQQTGSFLKGAKWLYELLCCAQHNALPRRYAMEDEHLPG
jgi:hypothetical protein